MDGRRADAKGEGPAPELRYDRLAVPPIDQLFDWIQAAQEGSDEALTQVEYSPDFGFPTFVAFKNVSENWRYEAANYQPR